MVPLCYFLLVSSTWLLHKSTNPKDQPVVPTIVPHYKPVFHQLKHFVCPGLIVSLVDRLQKEKSQRMKQLSTCFCTPSAFLIRLNVITHFRYCICRECCNLCNINNAQNVSSIRSTPFSNICSVHLFVDSNLFLRTCLKIWHSHSTLYQRINMRNFPLRKWFQL